LFLFLLCLFEGVFSVALHLFNGGFFRVGLEVVFMVLWVFEQIRWGHGVKAVSPGLHAIADVDIHKLSLAAGRGGARPAQAVQHIHTVVLVDVRLLVPLLPDAPGDIVPDTCVIFADLLQPVYFGVVFA